MTADFNFMGLDRLIADALAEDVGYGDITTECCVPEGSVSKGAFIAKESGVVCGVRLLERVFSALDARVAITPRLYDGSPVVRGEIIAEIEGPSRAILTGERAALNLLQRLSGIATCTRRAVDAVAGTKAKITDTRKTTPGLRLLEKYAVRCGGGRNHRFGLSDGILIKDNHIVAAGGIERAVAMARQNAPHTLKIEVETETLDQVRQALRAGADIIMLDNMPLETMAEAVNIVGGRALTEASGNMGEKDLRKVAETGVDFISIGALTHSARALDISLKLSSSTLLRPQP